MSVKVVIAPSDLITVNIDSKSTKAVSPRK